MRELAPKRRAEVLPESPAGLVQAYLHSPSLEGLREAFSRPLSLLREFSEMCVAGSQLAPPRAGLFFIRPLGVTMPGL